MESTQRIQFYQERQFGDLLSASFEFLRENFKALLTAFLLFIGPVYFFSSILEALNLTGFETTAVIYNYDLWSIYTDTLRQNAYILLAAVLAACIWNSVLVCYIKQYIEGEQQVFNLPLLWQSLRSNIGRLLGFQISSLVATAVATMLCFFPGIWCGVVLSLGSMVMICEDLGINQTFSRCFEIIRENWWFTFGLLLIVYVIQMVLAGIFAVPSVLLYFINEWELMGHSVETAEFGLMPLLTIVTSLLEGLGGGFFYSLLGIAAAFQYANLIERQEAPGLSKRLQTIATGDEAGEAGR